MVDGGPIDDQLKLATRNLHYVKVLPSIASPHGFIQVNIAIMINCTIGELEFGFIWLIQVFISIHIFMCMQGLNVYSILLHDTLVMTRDTVSRIVERMHTPINC